MHNLLFAIALASFVVGCSGGPVSEAARAKYDPAGIAKAALDQFDKNKNGRIEGAELDACPALKQALSALDKNQDKSLSAGEIQERVEQYARMELGPISCTVTLDDQALAGATVTFEPEPCMGASLKTATAKTDQDGVVATFQMEDKSVASLPLGLYRIKVAKDGTNIPSRYNTQTTLGREVFPDPRLGEVLIELALKGR